MHFEKEESEVGAMTFYLKRKGLEIFSYQLPWSQRLPFILYWQILRRESLLIFFYWHEALRAEKRKLSFSPGSALRSALRVANFQMKKDNVKRKPLGPG